MSDRIFHTAFFLLVALLSILNTRSIAVAQDSLQSPVPLSELPDSVWSVDSIMIVGNAHTKDFVVLREMTLRPGVSITKALLEYDQNRIYSLRLFNRVQLHVVPASTPGLAHLVVEVSERWYLFPFPVFGIKDRDWSKVYYGVGILHYNFRGRNEKLYAAIVLGYDPSFSLSYRNPFLSRDGTDFLDASVGYSKVRNKSLVAQSGMENFDEKHISAGLTLGKRFGIEHAVSVRAAYEYVEIDDPLPGRTISPSGIDRLPTVTVSYSYDTRNLGEYPSNGTLAYAGVTKYGLPSKDIDFVRYAIDLREFVPLSSSLTLAGRTFADFVAAGPTPSYNHIYFGYGERIRGHFREVWEGEERIGATTELRYTLLAPHYFNVGKLPPEFSVWRFGVVAALFADAGTVWFRGEPLAINRFIKGYGAGLHFLLPYSLVLRAEYALNEIRRGEFIIDVGSTL
ncbi:MAG: BamA/TamA family outer membrane protein [Ignavibacteriae bacterium]|nr:BamA/TamA family outer membrane protein [Ignavibacteria bacterium]MBI3364376.1 BamA/TamA family outer membrane protein [Ignavibacteriota bacterium]